MKDCADCIRAGVDANMPMPRGCPDLNHESGCRFLPLLKALPGASEEQIRISSAVLRGEPAVKITGYCEKHTCAKCKRPYRKDDHDAFPCFDHPGLAVGNFEKPSWRLPHSEACANFEAIK